MYFDRRADDFSAQRIFLGLGALFEFCLNPIHQTF